jgi:hypothetical protein
MHIYEIKCVEFNGLICFVRKCCYYLWQSKSTKGVGFEKNKKCFSCWYEVMYGQNSLYLYSPTEYNILQHTYIFTKFTTLFSIYTWFLLWSLRLVVLKSSSTCPVKVTLKVTFREEGSKYTLRVRPGVFHHMQISEQGGTYKNL